MECLWELNSVVIWLNNWLFFVEQLQQWIRHNQFRRYHRRRFSSRPLKVSFYKFNCNQFIFKTYRKLIRRVFLRLLLVWFLFWPFDHNFSRTRSWTPLVSLLSFRQYQHHGMLENHNFIYHIMRTISLYGLYHKFHLVWLNSPGRELWA